MALSLPPLRLSSFALAFSLAKKMPPIKGANTSPERLINQ